jgi:hypothetical protein
VSGWPAPQRPPEIIPFSPDYLSGVINIHDEEPLRTERARHEYETYFSLPKTKTFLAMRRGAPTAYATMGKGEDFPNCVHEWGGRADDLLCLLQKLSSVTGRNEVAILTPAGENELISLLNRLKTRRIFEYLAMMKVVNLEETAKAIAAHLFQGQTDFKILSVNGEAIIQLREERVRPRSERTLVRLLFGPDRPADLLNEASPAMARALECIFPIPLFIWGLDSV